MVENSILIGGVTIEHFLIFIFSFLATILAGNIAYTLLRRVFDSHISLRNSKLLARITQYIIYLSGTYYGVYRILGFDVTALFASFGVLTIAVAFSSQQIIQNFIAGILISIRRPIQIEDWMELLNPATGVSKVKDITLTHTILRNIEGKIFYIPNSLILASGLINYTKSGFVRVSFDIKVSAECNQTQLSDIILSVVDEHPKIIPNLPPTEKSRMESIFARLFEKKVDKRKFEPTVYSKELADGLITITTNLWIREVELKEKIISDVLNEMKNRFIKQKIKLKK